MPEVVEGLDCDCGFGFDSSDEKLVKTSKNLKIYTQTDDVIKQTITFAGSCKHLQQVDGHSVLLWNLGRGRMVDYVFLHSTIH